MDTMNRIDENTKEDLLFALEFYTEKFEETKDKYWQNEAKRIAYKLRILDEKTNNK